MYQNTLTDWQSTSLNFFAAQAMKMMEAEWEETILVHHQEQNIRYR